MAASKRSGLGRGLDSLFTDHIMEGMEGERVVSLPLSDIEPDPTQPRKYFEAETMAQLTASVRELGVLQPILVRPIPGGNYLIVAGERRWRAANEAGLAVIPAIVKDLSETEALLIALIENIQRKNLNPMEECFAYKTLMEKCALTEEECARRVGVPRPTVNNITRLAKLPPPVADMVRREELTAGHARTLLGIPDDDLIECAAKEVVEKKLSVRQTEQLAAAYKNSMSERKNSGVALPRPSIYDEVALHLEEFLGRRVEVRATGKEAGKLVITFAAEKDLLDLVHGLELLQKQPQEGQSA
jgi:ParB family chromosome partitioning protein